MQRGSNNAGTGERANHNVAQRNATQRRKYKTEDNASLDEPDDRNGCLNCIAGFFASRQLAHKDSEVKYLSSAVCELVLYILFLVTISVAAFGLRSFNGYFFNKLMTDLFVDAEFYGSNSDTPTSFRTSTDINDFWRFSETVMLKGLYRADWAQRQDRRPFHHSLRNVKHGNIHVGRPRLKQVRVLPSPCPVYVKLTELGKVICYLSYDKDNEDNSSLIKSDDIREAWIEQSVLGEAEGVFHWGQHRSYSGSGAYILLGTTEIETKQLIHQLKIWQWITRATRAVFLDFIVYNPNINKFAVVKLIWEFHPIGGMSTSWDIHTVKLDQYKTHFDYIILGFEIAFCVFTLYYFLQEITEICHLGVTKYLTDVWSWMDLLILAVSLLCITFRVYRYVIIKEKFESLLQDPHMFTYFEYFGFWESQFSNAQGVCVFLAWIKIFKYVSFNKTMGQISNTIAKCYNDITGFFMMFFLIFFGFVLLGYFLFFNQIRDFSSVGSTILTLLRFTFGDFNFEELEAANRILGPIFFFSYSLFTIFILMNMFLAIINENYEEVLIEIGEERKRFRLSRCLRSGCSYICSALCCKNNQVERPTHLLPNINGSISYAEIKDNLVSANFTQLEVETFLARHELDEDHIWDENDVHVILSHLENASYGPGPESQRRFSQLDEGIANEYPIDFNMSFEDLHELRQRIKSLEGVIIGVDHALDYISTRLDEL